MKRGLPERRQGVWICMHIVLWYRGQTVCCICTYHTGGGNISEGWKGSEEKVNGGAMGTDDARREGKKLR